MCVHLNFIVYVLSVCVSVSCVYICVCVCVCMCVCACVCVGGVVECSVVLCGVV